MDNGNWQKTRDEARAESERMLAVTKDAVETTTVTMPVGQFRSLAELLARLADHPGQKCDCMAPVDGVRFWALQPELDRIRAIADAAIAENERLREEIALTRWTC